MGKKRGETEKLFKLLSPYNNHLIHVKAENRKDSMLVFCCKKRIMSSLGIARMDACPQGGMRLVSFHK